MSVFFLETHKNHIDEWVKNDKKFVETTMSTNIAKELSKSNIIFVVGSTGHGKTSIIRHVALTLSNNHGYDIIPDVENPNIITKFHQSGRRQIFIVDNIGGRDQINFESVEAWDKHLQTIKTLVDEGSNCPGNDSGHQITSMLKVLISCEQEIYDNTKFKDNQVLKKNIIFLSNWAFTNEERMNIIRKYSGIGDMSTCKDCADLQFPLLCRLTVGMSKSQFKLFFKNPLEHIRHEFEIMQQTDKQKFFLITLCVVFKNGFTKDQLCQIIEGNTEEKINDLRKEFNFDTNKVKTFSRIIEKLDVLRQTYIHYENDRYSLIHNTIYAMAAKVCGSRYFDFFISYGSCVFIAQRYKLKSLTGDVDLIPIEKEKKYFNRLIKDLQDGNTYSTFQNKQLDNLEYREKLIKYFKEWELKMKEILPKINASTHNRNEMRDSSTYQNKSGCVFNLSPLMQSARKGYKDIVLMLLQMGCEINDADMKKRSPLYMAASCGRQEVVEVLLENQADINLCDDIGKSPLYAASREGHDKIIELLINKSDIDQCDNNGRSPLYVACEAGHKQVVELLVKANATLSKTDNTGASPLCVATQRCKNEVVEYLINSGAEVNHCDHDGRSPLFIACEEGHTDLVEILLDYQADPSSCDLHGRSPLYMAAKTGNKKVVKLLLSKNSEVINSTDDNDWTPLFVACDIGHTNVVKTILEHKPDVNFCDRLGLSPLHIACSKGHIDIIQLLLPRSNINKVDKSNRTSLYAACKAGHADIAKILLDNKADINISNKWGASVLYVACREGHQDVVEFLLKRNFEINKCDSNFMPLHKACEEGFVQIVNILIKNGVKINKSNKDQKTALDIAYANGHDDIVNVLLSRNAKSTKNRNTCQSND